MSCDFGIINDNKMLYFVLLINKNTYVSSDLKLKCYDNGLHCSVFKAITSQVSRSKIY